MVAHVYGVHGAVFERNSTKFTSGQLRHLVRPVEGDQPWHICRLFLRVGVHLKPSLYLVSFSLPSVLRSAGGEAGTAGVTARVAAALVITGAPV